MAGQELCRGGGLVRDSPNPLNLIPSFSACSVTQLTNILRQAVEEEDPLSQEITIPGKSFFFDGVRPSHFLS